MKHINLKLARKKSRKKYLILCRVRYQKAKQEAEDIFKEDINLSPEFVFSCIKHLQDLAIKNIDLDTKEIAFENFMHDFFKGKIGQYFEMW